MKHLSLYIAKRLLTWIIILLGLQAGTTTNASAEEYLLAPPSDWVTPLSFQEPQELPEDNIIDGVYLLLADIQVRPKEIPAEYYRHYAEKIINQQGIEYASQISIDFDPSYETLIVHKIKIHRNGQVFERFQAENISILQREEALEAQIYDGSKTLNIILNDVRIGDVLEYSYTLRGTNPVFNGRYYNSIAVQWRVPLHQYSHRLLWPEDRPLYIKNQRTELQPEIRQAHGMQEYIFSRRNIPAIIPDSDLPVWYSPYPRIQFSESETWAEVAQWGAKLYVVPEEPGPALRAKIQELKAEYEKPENRLIAALRFVQDEVRYMGIEVGPSSHKPHDPSTVFERRFGDCKDKVFLLRTLLALMEIESYPALVHTRYRQAIGEWQPSPYAFNHVILMVKIGETSYWVDPTRSYQRGSLENLAQPNYGVALILTEQSAELIAMSSPKLYSPKKEIKEQFIIPDGFDKATILKVETIFRGPSADYMRGELATESLVELEKSYTNYYASVYPEITATAPIEINDDQERNILTVRESYNIPNFWQKSEDEDDTMEAVFYPLELYNLIDQPTTRQREMPLSVPFPVFFRQTTHVQLPDDWEIDPYSISIEDEAAKFDYSVSYNHRELKMIHEYRSKKDHITPDITAKYIANSERIEDEVGYAITAPLETSSLVALERSWGKEKNWKFAMLALCIAVAIFLSRK